MKRKKVVITFLLAMLAIVGCFGCGSEETTGEKIFYVNFINNTSDKISGVHLEYSLDGESCGGGVTGNADNSLIGIGEELSWEFIPEDFPEDANLSKLEIKLFVLGEDGTEYIIKNAVGIKAKYGKTYTVNLTGDWAKGYKAELDK